MTPSIPALAAGAIVLKLPASIWPLLTGALTVFGAVWGIAILVGYFRGLRGAPLMRRSLVYAVVITPLAIYLSIRLTNRAG